MMAWDVEPHTRASSLLSPALTDSCAHTHTHTPRKHTPTSPQIPGVEVWFQRASDVVRKLRLGDIDLGIVGYDMFSEIGEEDR